MKPPIKLPTYTELQLLFSRTAPSDYEINAAMYIINNYAKPLLEENERLKELTLQDVFQCPSCAEEFFKGQLKTYVSHDKLTNENEKLKFQLSIAVEALEFYKKQFEYVIEPLRIRTEQSGDTFVPIQENAKEALEKIKELDK